MIKIIVTTVGLTACTSGMKRPFPSPRRRLPSEWDPIQRRYVYVQESALDQHDHQHSGYRGPSLSTHGANVSRRMVRPPVGTGRGRADLTAVKKSRIMPRPDKIAFRSAMDKVSDDTIQLQKDREADYDRQQSVIKGLSNAWESIKNGANAFYNAKLWRWGSRTQEQKAKEQRAEYNQQQNWEVDRTWMEYQREMKRKNTPPNLKKVPEHVRRAFLAEEEERHEAALEAQDCLHRKRLYDYRQNYLDAPSSRNLSQPAEGGRSVSQDPRPKRTDGDHWERLRRTKDSVFD